MIASYTCEAVEPLPFTCLSHDPGDSCAYHRLEDPAFNIPGVQYSLGAQPGSRPAPPSEQAETGAAGPSGSNTGAAAAAGAGTSVAASAPPAAQQDGRTGVPLGTFRPARMSEAALAMRAVCRSWCEVLSEGVRRLILQDPQPCSLWPAHFPRLTHLALGPCADLTVRHTAPAAPRGGGAGAGGDGDENRAGPGPSSAAAAAAAAAGGSGSGRRRTARRGAAGAAAGGGGGLTHIGGKVRSLAALTALRNLQVTDSTTQLDLAASCSSLEELVVVAQQHQHHQHGRNPDFLELNHYVPGMLFGGAYNLGVMGGGGGSRRSRSAGGGGGGGAAAAAPSVSRRSALDSTLGSLPSLQRLRLSGMDASAARLGSAIMGLSGLTSLRLHQCSLPTFFAAPARPRARSGSSAFGRELVMNLGLKLRDMSLQGCQLHSLPPEVLAGLTGLICLDLSANGMGELPATITMLQHLEYLDLQQNVLTSLPEGLSLLSRLADLDLSSNHLHSLPDDFGGLTRLTFLNLSSNHGLDMRVCSPLLASLTNLHSLGLSDLDLSEDPYGPHFAPPPPAAGAGAAAPSGPLPELLSALGPAGRLRELLLDGCGLETLPACISQLTQLSHLSIMENFDASGLPLAVTSLRGLAVLRLGYLDLSAPLPAGLFELTGLRELDLEQNFLPSLDPDVSKLTNLQVLNLVDAFDPDVEGSVIPWASIYRLSRLRHLCVSGPGEKPEPAEGGIGALTALEFLQLRGLPVPSAVLSELASSVRGLASLDLASAGITSLPTGFTHLTRLTELHLTQNRLARLPVGFGALTRLVELSLSYNRLRSLPADITRLCRLRALSLSMDAGTVSPPSPPQLAWMARVPDLALAGGEHLRELAKAHKIEWPRRVVYW